MGRRAEEEEKTIDDLPVQQLVGSGSVRIWTTSSYRSYFDPGQGEPDIGTGIIDREQREQVT